MKRMIMTMVAIWMMISSMNAQRLTDIQAEARFITDKMVVELGLSSAQRNNLLNINYVHHIYTKYPKHNWGHDKRRPRPECNYGRPGWPGGTHVTYGPGKPGKHHKHHKHDKKWKYDKKKWKHDRDWDDDDDDDDDD